LNALDAMSAVTDRPRVLRIRTSTYESAAILVALRDCGVGLNPEQMERLFEAFYTTKHEGMGMGLSISRSIVEAHGGRIWADPNGDGAAFHFTLPPLTPGPLLRGERASGERAAEEPTP
jgi:signal transduction histidine kinase